MTHTAHAAPNPTNVAVIDDIVADLGTFRTNRDGDERIDFYDGGTLRLQGILFDLYG